MLTVDDIEQIKSVISETILASEERIKSDIKNEMHDVFVSKNELKKESKKIWKELKYLRENLSTVIGEYDFRLLRLEERAGILLPRLMS